MFRYLPDLKEPGTAAQALGKAFHETIAYNFRQKQDSFHDLPVAECLEFFRKTLGEHLEEAVLEKGEHPMEFFELGNTMVQKYLTEGAPLIQPAAVESRVSGVIGGVKVAGYVDLLDIEGRIVDSKSTLKPPVGIAHDHRLQLTSYVMITSAASGICRLDTVTKGKTVRLVHKEFCDHRTGPPVCGSDLPHDPGLNPGWDILAASQQFAVLPAIFRVLETVRARNLAAWFASNRSQSRYVGPVRPGSLLLFWPDPTCCSNRPEEQHA
jgi:PD-(D/E)XK nuclease superfamily